MKPFNSFLATSLSLLLFQHPTINAIEVSRDVVIKNQTFLNDLVSEPITIDQANSLQLFDGPDITPVSYTHLDVYKRQQYNYVRRNYVIL